MSNVNLNLAPPPVPKVVNTEIIYSLPKTYNGKTVTDLFPEFKHNSVIFIKIIITYLTFYLHSLIYRY
jgi:hypothetical protein